MMEETCSSKAGPSARPSSPRFEIFISYARKDNEPRQPGDGKGWVTALRDEVLADQRKFSTEPLRIFFDTEDIRDMDDWRHRILEDLRHSRILLVCLSPGYFASEYCRWEWEEYTRRQVHAQMGIDCLAPVYFIDVPGSDGAANAQALAGWREGIMRSNYTDLRPWYPHGIEALRDEAVRRRIEALGTSLWERIQRARRADGLPGNLRRTNPHFVGRRTELRRLHENLALGAVGVVTAVHGLGGQGKTELAVAYAHGWADCYPAGLWVLGTEKKTEVLPLIGELTLDLGLPASADPEESGEQRGRRVLAEFKRRSRAVCDRDPDGGAACLVLLDNVSDPALLSQPQIARLPREDWLRVVATTRLGEDILSASRQKSLAFVAVDALEEEDALALLRDHQPDQKWATTEDESAARKIVRELGGFTLAIESVALYLGLHPEVRPAAYLARLKREGLPSADDLWKDPDVAAQIEHQEKRLALVLDTTLAQLSPVERTVLDYASFLPPDQVPWPWLRQLAEQEHPDALKQVEGYPDPWPALRRRLEGLRLLTPGDHIEIGRLHRLVGAHLRERMGSDAKVSRLRAVHQCLEQVGRLLDETADHEATHLWMLFPLQEALLHLDDGAPDESLALAADVAGGIEMTRGRLDLAGQFLQMAERHRLALHGADPASEDAARSLSVTLEKLGDFYLARGQAGDAEQALSCFNKALETSQQLFEANPNSAQAAREVSISLERLGDFYLARGQAGDAEQALSCFYKDLEIAEQLFESQPQLRSGCKGRLCVTEQDGGFLPGSRTGWRCRAGLELLQQSSGDEPTALRGQPQLRSGCTRADRCVTEDWRDSQEDWQDSPSILNASRGYCTDDGNEGTGLRF